MSEWKNGILGEIINLKRGYDLPKGIREAGEYPLYSSSGLSDRINEYKVKGPGVITGRYGSIGEVFYSWNDFWPLNTTLYVEDFKGNDEKFIYYYLKTINYNQYSDKSAVPGINRNHLHELAVKIPPLPVQRRIANILSSLDDKIENNCKTCEKLEEIAQAIFKRWFVDFEFPNEEGFPYKSSGGEMVYCEELGKEIVKGWRVATINDCCEKIYNGGTPKRDNEEYWNSNDIPWLTSGEVRENIINKTDNYISEQGFNNSSAKWAPALSTVVALYGATAGQVALLAIDTTTNQAVCSLIAKKHFAFYNYLVLSLSVKELFNKAIGSAQQNISKGIVENYRILMPSDKIIEGFDKAIQSTFFKIISYKNQIETLQQVRDALLPKLISGELAVDGAEV